MDRQYHLQRLLFKPTLLLALVAIFTFQVEAQIYKWVDENGKVHYSDKPPAHLEEDQTESITIEESKQKSANQNQLSAQERVKQANKWLDSQRQTQLQKDKEKATERKQLEKRQKECDRMKKEQMAYQRSNVIWDVNDKGETVYLNEQEREKLLNDMQQVVTTACSNL